MRVCTSVLTASFWLRLIAVSFCICRDIRALPAEYYGVDLACAVQPDVPALRLTWPQVDYARQYVVRKRDSAKHTWSEPPTVLPGDATSFTDFKVKVGTEYEYEVQMDLNLPGFGGETIRAFSYLASGIAVPLPDSMGVVLLVVDASVASGIAASIGTFASDLVGAGWSVVRRDVPRTSAPTDVKQVIRSEFRAHSDLRSVILIGHVPVPYSGNIAPDLHERHQGAWPADGYYGGELSGDWSDGVVSVESKDSPENDNYPGDGKFDPSEFPGSVTLEVGRIDFWNLPSFSLGEIALLNRYFEKNHRFRHRTFTAERRGLLHDNFGDVEGDAPAVDAWRHFSQFFGHGKISVAGVNQFLPALNAGSYLWSYGCGGGSYSKADGVADAAGFAANAPQCVFTILHGSYFGDWNTPDDLLRAAIASPGTTLASIWSGLPHWYLHHLAMGATLGFSTRLSQNNRAEYKSFRNFAANQVHIALMGDPTLEVFPVAPAVGLSGTKTGGGVELSWSPSTDGSIVGYKVFRADAENGSFQALTPDPIETTHFTDSAATGPQVYMVRAVKLEPTGSGTYYHASQGVFAKVDAGPAEHERSASISAHQGLITLSIIGRSHSSFNVLVSTNGVSWVGLGAGQLDAQGRAAFPDLQNGIPRKWYWVLWP